MLPLTARLPESWHASEQALPVEVSEESNHIFPAERGRKGNFGLFLVLHPLFPQISRSYGAKDHYKTVFDPQYRIIAPLATVVLTGFCYTLCGVCLQSFVD